LLVYALDSNKKKTKQINMKNCSEQHHMELARGETTEIWGQKKHGHPESCLCYRIRLHKSMQGVPKEDVIAFSVLFFLMFFSELSINAMAYGYSSFFDFLGIL
jgi:hypothetical protein